MVEYRPNLIELRLLGILASWVEVAHSIGTLSTLRAVHPDY